MEIGEKMSKKKNTMIPTNRGFKDNLLHNSETYLDYLNKIKEITVSMFEWVNLPSSMDPIYLELCLYYFGSSALLKTDTYGFINTKCSTSGYLNIYGKPTQINCYSYEFQELRNVYYGFKNENDKDNMAIIVYNNMTRTPLQFTIENFASRLANAQETIDINLNAQKTPVIIVTNDKTRLTLINAYSQFEGNRPVIFGDKSLDLMEKFKAIKTDAPFIVDKVQEYKKEIWNEMLTFLGIKNLQTNKRERLITNEADSNNELTNYNLINRLKVRKEACKQFNEYFNLSEDKAIDVKINSDLNNILKQNESAILNNGWYKAVESRELSE